MSFVLPIPKLSSETTRINVTMSSATISMFPQALSYVKANIPAPTSLNKYWHSFLVICKFVVYVTACVPTSYTAVTSLAKIWSEVS